jgi:chromosome partitioning protein
MLGIEGSSHAGDGELSPLTLTSLLDGEPFDRSRIWRARTYGGGALDLVPAGVGLAGATRFLAKMEFGAERALAGALPAEALSVAGYTVAILDTAPGWDPLAVAALFWADALAVPVALAPLALDGLASFLGRLDTVQAHRRATEGAPLPRVAALVPTFFHRRAALPAELMAQLEAFASTRALPLSPTVRQSVRATEAPAYGLTLFEHAPSSEVAADLAAAAEFVAAQAGVAMLPGK